MPKVIVNRKEFAADRGVSVQACAKWIAAGMPTLKDGRIDRKAACAWLEANIQGHDGKVSPAASFADSRARKEAALARLREFEAKKAEGELVEVIEMEKAWATAAQTIRDQFRAMPDRVAPELSAITDARMVRDRLRAEIDQILTDLPSKIIAAQEQKSQKEQTNVRTND